MNKKGSMELSVNSIVILVIAIVMLGLILGFVGPKFKDLNKQFQQSEPEAATPTSSDPITISRPELVVNAGEQLSLNFQVYALSDIASTNFPSITCKVGAATKTFDVAANGKTVSAGNVAKYQAVVDVPKDLPTGKNLCKLLFTAGTFVYPDKDLIVTVQ